MRDLLIFALIGVGTLGMRALFLVSSARLPDRVEQAMRHAKPAILASLVGGFLAGGGGGVAPGTVAALGVAWVVARRGKSMLVVVAAGLATALLIP